jgi:hypothetical protein
MSSPESPYRGLRARQAAEGNRPASTAPSRPSPAPVVLADRTMRARAESPCARCGRIIHVGTLMGRIEGTGWCHIVPCVVGPPQRKEDTP